MCLLICKPAGIILPEAHYRAAFADNGDGAGVAFAKDGKFIISKGWFKLKTLLKYIQANEKQEMMIHFRRASPGMDVSQEMCHPFAVDSTFHLGDDKKPLFRFAIGHNGKIAYQDTKKKSDTAHFVDEVIGPHLERDPWFLDHPCGRFMLHKAIGPYNKMAVMRYSVAENKVDTYIINDDEGYGDKQAHWKDKVWYSNYSYLPPKVVEIKNHTPIYQSYLGGFGGAVASEYSKPDKDGWKWDWTKDQWHNVNTGVLAPYLVSRPDRPNYIIQREQREKNGNPFAKGSEDKKPAKTDLDLLEDEAWAKEMDRQSEEAIAKAVKIFDMNGGVVAQAGENDLDGLGVPENAKHLGHLDLKERVILRRAASKYCKPLTGKANALRWTTAEMVAWLRSDMRELIPECKELADENLDKWIVMVEQSDSPIEVRISASIALGNALGNN